MDGMLASGKYLDFEDLRNKVLKLLQFIRRKVFEIIISTGRFNVHVISNFGLNK